MNTPAGAPALHGTSVLDLSAGIAGAFCTLLLADAGAAVWRVKPPKGVYRRSGDVQRRDQPDEVELAMGRGKRTIEVDLSQAAAGDEVARMAAGIDVIVDDLAPGVLSRIGISYSELRSSNPRLVTASITLWGEDRPDGLQDRDDAGVVAEAASTLHNRSHLDPSKGPMPYGFPLGETAAGLTAYAAVVSGLVASRRTGEGRHLPISMVHALLGLNPITITGAQIPAPGGVDRVAGYGIFRCADGHVILGVNTDKLWARLCECMGRSDLAVDPRYEHYQERDQHVDGANALVTEWTLQHTAAEIVDIVGPSGVPVGQVSTAHQVLGSSVFHRLDSLWQVDDGHGSTIQVPANPLGFDSFRHLNEPASANVAGDAPGAN